MKLEMAGIYIHIPFCKRICSYCDFYRVASLIKMPDFFNALMKELRLRKSYLDREKIDTIYFGGGTPSVMLVEQIHELLDSICQIYNLSDNCEITLEANPDDLTKQYLKNLKRETAINRLSIGIQSFNDSELLLMNRRHNAKQAMESVYAAHENGFSNISIDLIYGLPGMNEISWEKNLNEAFKLNISHLSAYHLNIEPKTQFANMVSKGIIRPVEEEESLAQYNLLRSMSHKNGFIHYEISNFAHDNYYSRHNTNYWKQRKYIGLGPSAHSYNLESRQWNISSVIKYINAIETGEIFYETEKLNRVIRFNEYLIVSLRTIWGANIKKMEIDFGHELTEGFLQRAKPYLISGKMKCSQENYFITPEGWFISDTLLSHLIMET